MMRLARELCLLKKELSKTRGDAGSMQEIIPKAWFGTEDTRLLNLFAEKNPIYYNSYEERISGTDCIVLEGDINEYWLGSIMQESSRAPFSPTWISSAYLLASRMRELGFREAVDVGSGDGRIAYCAKMLGMGARSIEVDQQLARLQDGIADKTGLDFRPICADATRYDFAGPGLEGTAFCIGGLAQMGGDALASAIMDSIRAGGGSAKGPGFVFAGTHLKKYAGSELDGGWGTLIRGFGLTKIETVSLPTAWTFKEHDDTPYIFARL